MNGVPQPLTVHVTDNTTKAPSKPKMVDEAYWLERGRTILDESAKNCDAAAARLVTAVAWFWTVYTGTTIVGLSILDRDLGTGSRWLVGLPVLVLVAAYAAAHWAAMPDAKAFDGRFPEQIQELHNSTVTEKWFRLRVAMGVTALGAVLVAVAIPVALVTDEASGTSVGIAVRRIDDVPTVLLSGHLDGASEATVTIEPKDGTAVSKAIDLRAGSVDQSVPVAEADEYEVTVIWETDSQVFRVTETEAAPAGKG